MPLVKHDYPVLEYDTASKAVFQPGNGKKCFPAKAVFAFLGDEVENYAHTHDGIQIDEFESATRRHTVKSSGLANCSDLLAVCVQPGTHMKLHHKMMLVV